MKFSSSKTLVGEAACPMEFSRINAFGILRANSNDLFVPEFNDNPRNELEKL